MAAGEWLFIHVWMEEQPGEGVIRVGLKHLLVGRDQIPTIGIILPACVGMFYRHVEGPCSITAFYGAHVQNVSVA